MRNVGLPRGFEVRVMVGIVVQFIFVAKHKKDNKNQLLGSKATNRHLPRLFPEARRNTHSVDA
jgi:hypothetical protein